MCYNFIGYCIYGCIYGFYGDKCDRNCNICLVGCYRKLGNCLGDCLDGRYGGVCDKVCK